MTDIVLVSLEPWDQVWRRNQHLADGLLRADPSSRILFVEPGSDPLHDLSSRRRPRRGGGLRPAAAPAYGERLWLLAGTKWLPRRVWHGYDAHWARSVTRAADAVGLRHPVLWANDPRAAHIGRMVSWRMVYDITDDWLAADRPAPEAGRLEEQESFLLEAADEVVVCSTELARRKGSARPVHLIPNAIAAETFGRPHPRPGDLPDGTSAVYVGTLHRDRLDLDLCLRTARALEGAGTLVMVGPDALSTADRSRLERHGVRVLGARPYELVPGYLQHAEALVVPHVDSGFTASLDPIKRYEYAASGRPAVVTPVAGFVDGVDGVRVVAPEAFPAVVGELLRSPPPDRAVPAGVPTWAERVSAFRQLIDG